MYAEAKLNGKYRKFPVLENPMVGTKQLQGFYIKIANAYCNVDTLEQEYDMNADKWLNDKLN